VTPQEVFQKATREMGRCKSCAHVLRRRAVTPQEVTQKATQEVGRHCSQCLCKGNYAANNRVCAWWKDSMVVA